jgi:hypothetical protein
MLIDKNHVVVLLPKSLGLPRIVSCTRHCQAAGAGHLGQNPHRKSHEIFYDE